MFLVIMFGRRKIEAKYRLRLNLFSLVLIDGITAGILVFLLTSPVEMEAAWKYVVLIGGTVLLLGAGVLWPYLRYRKRMENGTLPPIRLPEEKEDEQKTEKPVIEDGSMTVEQKVAAMMRDLDDHKDDEQK